MERYNVLFQWGKKPRGSVEKPAKKKKKRGANNWSVGRKNRGGSKGGGGFWGAGGLKRGDAPVEEGNEKKRRGKQRALCEGFKRARVKGIN